MSAYRPASADPHDHADGHDHDAAAPGHDHGHDHDEHDHGDHGHDHGDHGHDHGEHGHEHATGIRGFLIGLFKPHSHDVADKMDTALESSAKGIRATKISLVVLFATAFIQLLLVWVTNSVALLADTIHNFGDALTSIPLWIAFVIGRRAVTRGWTFGYRRAEDLAGLFIVVMIGLSAIWVVVESLERLVNPVGVEYLPIVIAAGVLGFLGNEAVALYRIRVGKEIQSAALIADGYHARTDGITSLGVVVGGIGVAFGFPQADPLMGLVIAGMIVLILVGAIRQVFGRLMDVIDPKVVDRIEELAEQVDGVHTVSSIKARWLGHRLDISLYATVDCEMTVAEGHRVAEEVRHALFHEMRGVDSVVVHIDPCEHEDRDHHATTRDHDGTSPARVASGQISAASGGSGPPS